jgi:hypothetical protein
MGTTDPAASALDDVRAELLAAFLAEVDRPAAEAALPAAAAARLADPATSAAERRLLSAKIGQSVAGEHE